VSRPPLEDRSDDAVPAAAAAAARRAVLHVSLGAGLSNLRKCSGRPARPPHWCRRRWRWPAFCAWSPARKSSSGRPRSPAVA